MINILDYIIGSSFCIDFFLIPGILEILINGIAFISEMESVLRGVTVFNSGEVNEKAIEVILSRGRDISRSQQDFKIIITDYVCNDYYKFNNISEAYIFNINNLIQFVSIIFVSIEGLLLGFQKVVYEIFGYVFDLCN